jgi:hypothetical protein
MHNQQFRLQKHWFLRFFHLQLTSHLQNCFFRRPSQKLKLLQKTQQVIEFFS